MTTGTISAAMAAMAAAAPLHVSDRMPPGVTPPDYVVTMEQTFPGRKGSSTRVVIRHGEWTRIDSTYPTPPETTYKRHGRHAGVADKG